LSFSDPQSVTIGASTISLPRTGVGQDTAAYTSADGLTKLSASHAYGKRTRRTIRLDSSKLTADPFIPATNTQVGMSAYLVVDLPKAGFSVSDQTDVVKALMNALSASTYAELTKLLGGES
jgi:hypothetical protein